MSNDSSYEKDFDDDLSISGFEDKIFIEENPNSLENKKLSKLAQNCYDNQMNGLPKNEINLDESNEKENKEKDISGKEIENLIKLDSSIKYETKNILKCLEKKEGEKYFYGLRKILSTR